MNEAAARPSRAHARGASRIFRTAALGHRAIGAYTQPSALPAIFNRAGEQPRAEKIDGGKRFPPGGGLRGAVRQGGRSCLTRLAPRRANWPSMSTQRVAPAFLAASMMIGR